MRVTQTRGLDEKCTGCGIALHKHEIAFEVNGQYIDYTEHCPGDINLTLCSGCRDRILHNIQMDQGDAILRRIELDNEKRGPAIDASGAMETYLEENPMGITPPDGTGQGI